MAALGRHVATCWYIIYLFAFANRCAHEKRFGLGPDVWERIDVMWPRGRRERRGDSMPDNKNETLNSSHRKPLHIIPVVFSLKFLLAFCEIKGIVIHRILNMCFLWSVNINLVLIFNRFNTDALLEGR